MRVLITRAEPAASRTAQKLEAFGHTPIVCPIFELVDLGGPDPDQNSTNYIFTSANAVEVLLKRNWTPGDTSATAWCVGTKTETAAKVLGFQNTVVASGGGAKLAEKITNTKAVFEEPFIYPTTPDRSFNIQQALSASGIKVETVDIYRTAKVMSENSRIASFFSKSDRSAIMIYSERSASHLISLLKDIINPNDVNRASVISISKSAANMMLNYGWEGVYVSERPDEASMISRLEEVSKA